MQFSKLLAAATLFVSSALAADYACGSNTYSASEVSAAQDAGYKLYQEGSDANDYPHQYNDYEGFDFPVPGDWYEFPILSSGKVYDGGSPGADRVIFNEQGKLAGLITHTGASGNDFVACDGDDF